MTAIYHVITECRSCGDQSLTDVLSLGNLHISTFIPDGVPSPGDENRCPLDLVQCRGCGLVQIRHTVDRSKLYGEHYWYRSSTSKMVRDDLVDVVRLAEKLVPLEDGDIVLDIASNDGYLLGRYSLPTRAVMDAGDGLVKIGFDPAENLAEDARQWESYHFTELFSAEPFLQLTSGRKAKVITSCAVFYHLEDPNAFTADVARCLDDDGVWIIEASHLYSMLENNAFDSIGHEHLTHLRLRDVEDIVDAHGLRVVDAWVGGINCGVMRLVVTHETKPFDVFGIARVEALWQFEKSVILGNAIKRFMRDVERVQDQFHNMLVSLKRQGKTVAGITASTKGNIFLQCIGVTPDDIPYIGDANSDKWYTRCVGSEIPVVSLQEMREDKPDVLVIFAWHLAKEIAEQERQHLPDVQFLTPLPEVRLFS